MKVNDKVDEQKHEFKTYDIANINLSEVMGNLTFRSTDVRKSDIS